MERNLDLLTVFCLCRTGKKYLKSRISTISTAEVNWWYTFSFGSMEKKDWNPLEHQTIKFTAGWSKTSTNFLHLTESITEDIKETDLYAKTADSDKYFLSSSCHHSYWKKHIPCSRALRLNRSCLNNQLFDKKCNGLRNKGTTMRKWYIRKNFEL